MSQPVVFLPIQDFTLSLFGAADGDAYTLCNEFEGGDGVEDA